MTQKPTEPAAESQRTIAAEFVLDGRGLHSGNPARAVVKPGEVDTGIIFRRIDLHDQPTIAADVSFVTGVDWQTVIGEGECIVRTVEHLLAAVAAHRLDNLEIHLDGAEPPALDGSAIGWCEAIRGVGSVIQEGIAPSLVVRDTITVDEGASRYVVTPADEYRVSARIDFDHPAIGDQYASVPIDAASFGQSLAPARTFGLASWAEPLQSRGLALGSGPENTIVLPDDELAPPGDLRFPDEFVRHKILDIVGDLALVGARLQAHIIAERPSHRGNVALARRLRQLRSRPADGSPALDISTIMEHLPHRYPMLLVDRVIELEMEKRILAIKNVSINEPFFQGHFPGHPIMPGVLIVEAMAQAGGLLLMNRLDSSNQVVYFLGLDEVRFRRPVVPGDQLEFEVETVQIRSSLFKMRGVARVAGQVVAEGTMMARFVDK
jgi:UDP-3-O-[3-hydroxymyristoyl] N-acetylglucosamine deacetylase/3-hydroxyacyl-[acyl-carrier-protein] dehydratase